MQADWGEARAALFERRQTLIQARAVQTYRVAQTRSGLEEKRARHSGLREHVEEHRTAGAVMQELVDAVAARNIAKVEDLVNAALRSIFPEHDLQFRVFSEVKRNLNTYRIAVIHDGLEGSRDAFGGGVLCVVAMVLKVLFNLFSKRYPLLCFDESLWALSEQHIPAASRFMRDLARDFGMPIVLVTHQPAFAQASDRRYVAESAGSRTVRFTEVAA